MPGRRRRREVEMERVLGTPALFATAYGNVGSSIYYALGLTAVYALGLTPLVFVVAGVVFAATAATYAEGTARFPEAGGSASFSRHAFDELVSFTAGWAQMLVYVVTVAVSAFFVPHYLSIFWEPLNTNPWDIVVGAIVIVDPRHAERGRRAGGGEAVHLARGRRLRDAGAARDRRVRARLQPGGARRQRPLGRRADVVEPRDRDPRGDARVHGCRDRLEPRRGGAGPGPDRAERVQARRRRGLRDLLHAPARRALGASRRADRRPAHDAPRASRRRTAATRTTRSSASSRTSGSRAAPRRGRDLRRHPRRDDPLHRDERGRDRRVAHHLLDGDVPAAARGVSPAPPAVQDAVALARALRRDRADPPDPARAT